MAERDTRPDEDRLLRVWTPRILRGALAASAALLVTGLLIVWARDPAAYVATFRAVQRGSASVHHEGLSQLAREMGQGQGRALLVAGLLVLTLVPIGRVVFTVVLFVRERDWLFAALTGLVLTLLGVGLLLGRMG